jgi:hypothetical protein
MFVISDEFVFYDASPQYVYKTMVTASLSSVSVFSCLLGETTFDLMFPYWLLMILIMFDYTIL